MLVRFAEAEQILLKYGGQLHLGKATRANTEVLARMYGARWNDFQRVRQQQDPHGKFLNDFAARLLDDGAQAQAEGPAAEPERLAG